MFGSLFPFGVGGLSGENDMYSNSFTKPKRKEKDKVKKMKTTKKKKPLKIRKDFPETWLWADEKLG